MEKSGIKNYSVSSYVFPSMSDAEFYKFSRLILKETGIHITDPKKTMLSSRLFKRLKELNMDSYSRYFEYVTHVVDGREEVINMIDAVSTNKTEFFRESDHFNILESKILPDLISRQRFMTEKKLHAWSAGCSTGEEPYSIGKIISEFLSVNQRGDFSILATDISTQALKKAESGIYTTNEMNTVPEKYRIKYTMKGSGPMEGFHRIVPELRRKVLYQRLNFMDDTYSIKNRMDFIFCRNVVIYFEKENQQQVYRKLHDILVPGGYLFIGHSETINSAGLSMTRIAPTVFQKEF